MVTIKATVFLDKSFWVGTFERTDKEGYAVAKHIFGGEPTNAEVYEFVANNYTDLNFGAPKEFKLEIKRMNPKRVQREVRKEMDRLKDTQKPSTLSQDYMREELEKNKLERKKRSSKEKREQKQEQFALRQEKKKKKQKGH